MKTIFSETLKKYLQAFVSKIHQYSVIHKSTKHFKNPQQINYSTDHGSSQADRERNSPSYYFFLHISQLLNVSAFGNTADIYAIVHLVPHACQHITIDQSHSSGDTVAKIWRLVGSGSTKTQTPRRKSRTGLNPVTGVATALTSHLLFLCVLSKFVASFD